MLCQHPLAFQGMTQVTARRPDQARRYLAQYRALAGFIVVSAAFAAIFVALTLSAYHAPRPHDLPVGIVAPAAVTSRVEHALDGAAPGAFGWRGYPSEAGARTGIEQREVNGALVASGPDLRLLVAQAGGSGPAQVLTQAFGAVAARSGRHLVVTDAVPPLPGDTLALSSFFVVLAVLIPSLAAGSGSALAFRRARPALAVAAPVAVAVVIGLVSAAVADGIAGLGNYAAIAGVVALFSLAVAAPTALLARIWPPLVTVAVLVLIVFGIPVSGGPANLASFGPAFLRVLDPVLPLGVAASVVRNVVYFGGHATALHLWVLTAWALAGVAGLIVVTTLRRPAPALTSPSCHQLSRPVLDPRCLTALSPRAPRMPAPPGPPCPSPWSSASTTPSPHAGRSSGPRTSSGRAPEPCTSSMPTMCSSTVTCPESPTVRWTRPARRRPPAWRGPPRRSPPRQGCRTRSSAARDHQPRRSCPQPASRTPQNRPAHPSS